jgi:hypothetical protein
MSRAAPTRDAILELLRHYQDGLTKDEIAAELGKHPAAIEASIWHDRHKHGTENIRIAKYQPVRGRGGRAQAVYVLGPGPDAERPDLSGIEQHRARNARYRERHRARINARLRVLRGSPRPTNPFQQLMK